MSESKREGRASILVAMLLLGAVAVVLVLACPAEPQASMSQDLTSFRSPGRGLGRPSTAYVFGDTLEVLARRAAIGRRLSAPDGDPLVDSGNLPPAPVAASLLLRPRMFHLSRLGCAIYGADFGAGAASAVGGLGLVTGVWGEHTAAYLMGTGAILGALWGGLAGPGDAGFRIRIDPTSYSSSDRRSRAVEDR